MTIPVYMHIDNNKCGNNCPFKTQTHSCSLFNTTLYFDSKVSTDLCRCKNCIDYTASLALADGLSKDRYQIKNA